MLEATVDPDRAIQLRHKVADQLVADNTIVSPQVEAAMRRVPRHLFTPEASLEEAYRAYSAVVTKTDEHGTVVSSVSAPQIQAMMLEQTGIAPGMRVLEIGSGGCNAALLAELVGPSGQVTTVDIDPDITERATRLLAATGYERVRVVCVDAGHGVAEYAPYDRILVTAGAWDIPPAWTEQLVPDGRIVVPLRMRGLTRSVAFRRTGDHLTSTSTRTCGFVPMQGTGAHQEQLLLVNGTEEIRLRFDDGLPADQSLPNNAVRAPRAETWTGVVLSRWEPVETLQMYLATVLPGFCIMSVDSELGTGPAAPSNKQFSLATVDAGNFAYLTVRRTADDKSVEYGVHAFGPEGPQLAEAVAEQVRTWGRERRGGPGPRIHVHPAGTPDDRLPGGRVIDKKHCRVTISWPPTTTAEAQDIPQPSSTRKGEGSK